MALDTDQIDRLLAAADKLRALAYEIMAATAGVPLTVTQPRETCDPGGQGDEATAADHAAIRRAAIEKAQADLGGL